MSARLVDISKLKNLYFQRRSVQEWTTITVNAQTVEKRLIR